MNIAMQQVESSQIRAIGHDPATNTLAVRFKDNEPGSLYHYSNFTAADFEALRNAESVGKYFSANVKKNVAKHPFVKVEG